MEASKHGVSTLRDYLRVVRRRKWIILQAVVLVPLAAVLLSLHEQKLYKASSQVLLSTQNLANSLDGIQDPSVYQQADRTVQTQAEVARVPSVAKGALSLAGIHDRTPDALLAHSSVAPATNANLLEISVTDPVPATAVRLATAYSRAFTEYRRKLDTSAIARALAGVEAQIAQIRAAGDTRSALLSTLLERDQQLRTMEALATSNAFVVEDATGAAKVQPKPTRNGILGFVLGIVLGLGLAFLWEALDTRVRSAEEISEKLGLPLLARLPEPPRRLRSENKLAMLADPEGVAAEPFRMLRTNLDFANLQRKARTIMVTSGAPAEGKSTTVANLAASLARAGRRVILVDLDLRRPYLDRFFGLQGHAGLTEVVLGRVDLDDALFPIVLTRGRATGANGNGNGYANGNGNGNGKRRVDGMLHVLTAGPTPPDAGEFVGTDAVAHVLEQLAERADVVLIDTPPMLHVGDALALSKHVDGLILITRMNVVRRPMLRELERVLESVPARPLGFVVAGAAAEDGYGETYGYGYGYGYGRRGARALPAQTEETV